MSAPTAKASSLPASGRSTVVAVWLDTRDDVATALRAVEPGERVRVQCGSEQREVVAREAIPLGHKIALTAMSAGTRIRKYGEFIGRLTDDVAEGDWVHTHNLATTAQRTPAAAPDKGRGP